MIHRFIDVDDGNPILAVLGVDSSPVSQYSIWQIGNRERPRRVPSTAIDIADADYLADPSTSPDLDADGIPVEFCYGFVGAASGTNSVRVCGWGGSPNTAVVTAPAAGGGGFSVSMQPEFSPDGAKIVYRYTDDPWLVRVADRDGSNVTTLWSASGEPSPNDVRVLYPTWNHDGTKIAFLMTTIVFTLIMGDGHLRLDSEIIVMDDDGSNVTTVASKTGVDVASPPNLPYKLLGKPAWARGSDVLAYTEIDTDTVTDPQYVKTVNADGTGTTTIHTFTHSGYSAGESEPDLSVWAWTSDDEHLVSSYVVSGDPDPKWVLTKIAADGSGLTDVSPERRLYSYTNDYEPIVHRGRIYWNDGDVADGAVSSVLEDETDYFMDWHPGNTPPSVFHGFRGDTITA